MRWCADVIFVDLTALAFRNNFHRFSDASVKLLEPLKELRELDLGGFKLCTHASFKVILHAFPELSLFKMEGTRDLLFALSFLGASL